MDELKLPLLLSSMLLAPAAWTQDMPDGPIADLQAQVTDLGVRISALEAAAPTASVEGRTYCFVLDLTVMRGVGINQTEHLATSIIRRTATFDGGLFEANLLSHTRNTQRDDGTVTPSIESSPDPIYGTYTQNGNRLDVVLDNGTSASWYVSEDGSMISGTSITFYGPPMGDVMLTVGRTRHYTLVESDNCLAELL
jgi:hypothetical protein